MELVLPSEGAASKRERKLLDQVRDVMRLKHYSLRTEQTYCDWIALAKLRAPQLSPFLGVTPTTVPRLYFLLPALDVNNYRPVVNAERTRVILEETPRARRTIPRVWAAWTSER